MNQAPVLLMILDGCGLRKETAGNAVAAAKKPNLERLWRAWPHTTLGASGLDVGLPDGQMGNSEVGHTNLGAGRIVYQELTRISKSIADGDFFSNPALCAACDAAGSTGTLHLMGLLSDGGVHSHLEHLFALISLARRRGVRKLAVHCFMDGRDTDPHAGAAYLGRLEQALEQNGLGFVATVTGRYYAMDRDKRWERVREGVEALVRGQGVGFDDALTALRASYADGLTDEFIRPLVKNGYAGMADGDAVIFYNFRPDRARELTRALVDPAFDGFSAPQPRLSAFVCMTRYDATMPDVRVAFAPAGLENSISRASA
ncbi:MAG: 2,3-bisphosphoglycerate-independent phosphoglycerate mutase [Oscillospiraceae bacterium]